MIDKTWNNTSIAQAKKVTSDIEVFGDGDAWKLICKASSQSEGWMKSTKALATEAGCLVQVSTQQCNPDGSYAVAEALQWVDDMTIDEIKNERGEVIERKLRGPIV